MPEWILGGVKVKKMKQIISEDTYPKRNQQKGKHVHGISARTGGSQKTMDIVGLAFVSSVQ